MCKRIVSMILVALALFSVTSPTAAQLTTTVYVDPPSTTVFSGEIFSVNITIANVTDLYGWDFRLYYRNDVLNATEIFEGPFLKSAGNTSFGITVLDNAYNATHGRACAYCMLIGAIPGANGNGTLATITFRSIGKNTTIIDFFFTDLIDSKDNHIQHNATNGQVTIIKILGDVDGDGDVDSADLFALAPAYGSQTGDPLYDERCDFDNDGDVDSMDLFTLAPNYGKTA